MSDVVVTPEGAAVVIDPSSTPAPAPASKAEGEPTWLPARLERERQSLLRNMGVDSVDDAKKAIAVAKAQEEASKTAAQKAAELEQSSKAKDATIREQAEALSAYAKSQLSVLTEAQRSAVALVAGDDPAKQLKTIEALKPTWASAAAPAAPVPAAAPQNTAPPQSAPKGTETISAAPDHKAIHAELMKSNPILAARYAFANGVFENK